MRPTDLMADGITSDICPAKDRSGTLAVLYQHLPHTTRELQIAQLLEQERAGLLALSGLLQCRGPSEVVGAMLTMPASGRVMMAWPPVARQSFPLESRQAIWRSLCQASIDLAQRLQARFIQLLESDSVPERLAILEEAGFRTLTHLVYAKRPLVEGEAVPVCPDWVELVAYREELERDLMEILAESYRGSMDCPELTGLRSLEDVVASHKGQGEFDPSRWLLARCDGKWVGCLLLSRLAGGKQMEISYVAVLPYARGKGLGPILTHEAIRRAAEAGCEEVVLAVDGRNIPALAMYEDVGFAPWDLRQVFLFVLDPADGRFDRSLEPKV